MYHLMDWGVLRQGRQHTPTHSGKMLLDYTTIPAKRNSTGGGV